MHAIDAIPVSDYRDWENPVGSMEEAENYLIAAAANTGVNGVLILDSPESVRNFDSKAEENVGFMCVLLLIPQARLGLEFETGTGYEHRFVIRRIQNAEAETAGLRIGDSILAINGIDLVQSASAARNDRLKWEIGQVVQVTVARDGRERTFPVKVIANPPALPRASDS
jgi:predicted metalloprotease with PDZ domain